MKALRTLRHARSTTLPKENGQVERVEMQPMSSHAGSTSGANGTHSSNANGKEEKGGEGRSLAELPERVLLLVLEKCAPVEGWFFSQTCRALRSLLKTHPEIWAKCMHKLCDSLDIPPGTFVPPSSSVEEADLALSQAAKKSIHFACITTGRASPTHFDPRPLPLPVGEPLTGCAFCVGGRWLITRTLRSVQAWDLAETPVLPQKPAAVWELDGSLGSERADESLDERGVGFESVVQVCQGERGHVWVHVPHITKGAINSQILSLSPPSPSSPATFAQLGNLHSALMPPGTRAFSFSGHLVAGEFETAITVWDWEKDAWITFTEDNFFDEPKCPEHATVQLHLIPTYVLASWGGELKLFLIPPLRARRPRTKPSFVTVQALWSVPLPGALNQNPRIGRILDPGPAGGGGVGLALLYPTGSHESTGAQVYFWRISPVGPERPRVHQLPSAGVTRDGDVPVAEFLPAALAGGRRGQGLWALVPGVGSCFLLQTDGDRGAVVRHVGERLALPWQNAAREAKGEGEGEGKEGRMEVCVDCVSGRVVLLDRERGGGEVMLLALPDE